MRPHSPSEKQKCSLNSVSAPGAMRSIHVIEPACIGFAAAGGAGGLPPVGAAGGPWFFLKFRGGQFHLGNCMFVRSLCTRGVARRIAKLCIEQRGYKEL